MDVTKWTDALTLPDGSLAPLQEAVVYFCRQAEYLVRASVEEFQASPEDACQPATQHFSTCWRKLQTFGGA